MLDIVYIIFILIFSAYRLISAYNYLTSKISKKNSIIALSILFIEVISFLYLFISKTIPLTIPPIILLSVIMEVFFGVMQDIRIFVTAYLVYDLFLLFYIIKNMKRNNKLFNTVIGITFLLNGIFSLLIIIT
ncbi:MAG: hypothetical protein KBF12_09725 [Sebaldella sp.]|nr:hypothetical protein [Sebaldella sp.]